ncbi:zinc finger protein 454 [Etheostoma spectabile]|nr:zinc finger protein 454-like [Etheostoma spectabile]
MDRHRKQQEVVLKPETKLRGEALPLDVQKVIVGEEHQHEWSSNRDQEEPEPPHIKEEQEELWISQDREQLQGLEETDTKFPFTAVPVKSEEDEEKPEFSQRNHRLTVEMDTVPDEEDCGGPEPAIDGLHSQPDNDDKNGDSSEAETDDSADWKEPREPQSGLNSLNNDVPVCDSRCSTGEKSFSCFKCGKGFGTSVYLKRDTGSHKEEEPFSCTICRTSFAWRQDLKTHMTIHTGEKSLSCLVCKKVFIESGNLKTHMRIHTREKPFSCSVCKKAFTDRAHLQRHMRIHTGKRPFSCSEMKEPIHAALLQKEHPIYCISEQGSSSQLKHRNPSLGVVSACLE